MTIRLITPAQERGTYPIRLRWRDPLTGSLITPLSVTWTLRDHTGATLVEPTAMTGMASEMWLVLSGEQLRVETASGVPPYDYRVTIEARYNATYGSNLPLTAEIAFSLAPLDAIPMGA
jgi:hypothetical protein